MQRGVISMIWTDWGTKVGDLIWKSWFFIIRKSRFCRTSSLVIVTSELKAVYYDIFPTYCVYLERESNRSLWFGEQDSGWEWSNHRNLDIPELWRFYFSCVMRKFRFFQDAETWFLFIPSWKFFKMHNSWFFFICFASFERERGPNGSEMELRLSYRAKTLGWNDSITWKLFCWHLVKSIFLEISPCWRMGYRAPGWIGRREKHTDNIHQRTLVQRF